MRLLLVVCLSSFFLHNTRMVHLSGHAQGTTWQATYFASDSSVSNREVDSILIVIDSSMSIYKPWSTIVAFNNSSSGIKIDKHFKKVILQSLETYKKTNGLSDITVFPLVEAWGFGAKPGNSFPDDNLIRSILPCVGSGKIHLSGDSLLKSDPCVKIDVNGVAQGYSVDVIADYFESRGIENYIIELGGELRVKGKKGPSGEPFKVGIESPSGDDFTLPPMQKIISLNSGAITTSGNYRKYHESKGKKVSHIINPKTGQPVNNDLISVTVYAKNAIIADAYDNALMLMGLDSALKFIEKEKEMAAFFVYKRKDGSLADTASARFQHLIVNEKK
jgi:thiamine biosynthesis lipoprotein